ncbi:hypothetical protein NE237_031993 [Protea cynaroides]|uniref:Uncharacterized protein n=1 Tax=Protea cynaroides TaxID=273540 RepID=A0A9Q0L3I1_9MAGN|nr:hypothetical protein NE237_031993 [Protea cynaroides]
MFGEFEFIEALAPTTLSSSCALNLSLLLQLPHMNLVNVTKLFRTLLDNHGNKSLLFHWAGGAYPTFLTFMEYSPYDLAYCNDLCGRNGFTSWVMYIQLRVKN